MCMEKGCSKTRRFLCFVYVFVRRENIRYIFIWRKGQTKIFLKRCQSKVKTKLKTLKISSHFIGGSHVDA